MSDGSPLRESNHLRAWREFRGMTQDQLAEAVDTTGSQISQLESGGRGLSAKWLRKLAPVLGTSPGILLDHHPDDVPKEVMALWERIPEANRDQALRVLQTFALAS